MPAKASQHCTRDSIFRGCERSGVGADHSQACPGTLRSQGPAHSVPARASGPASPQLGGVLGCAAANAGTARPAQNPAAQKTRWPSLGAGPVAPARDPSPHSAAAGPGRGQGRVPADAIAIVPPAGGPPESYAAQGPGPGSRPARGGSNSLLQAPPVLPGARPARGHRQHCAHRPVRAALHGDPRP